MSDVSFCRCEHPAHEARLVDDDDAQLVDLLTENDRGKRSHDDVRAGAWESASALPRPPTVHGGIDGFALAAVVFVPGLSGTLLYLRHRHSHADRKKPSG